MYILTVRTTIVWVIARSGFVRLRRRSVKRVKCMPFLSCIFRLSKRRHFTCVKYLYLLYASCYPASSSIIFIIPLSSLSFNISYIFTIICIRLKLLNRLSFSHFGQVFITHLTPNYLLRHHNIVTVMQPLSFWCYQVKICYLKYCGDLVLVTRSPPTAVKSIGVLSQGERKR
jgi:hypothetical protein